ncbi:MAG TPA: hypothetical protein VJU16_04010 [Planctomycetota bacterium]|nr:hypothetical protein [Planctomycetota bacterium]
MKLLSRATDFDQLLAQPGLWFPAEAEGTAVIISCPGCGDQQHLRNKIWKVAADGTVSPSVDHSQPIRKTDGTVIRDCLFHDYIKLEGWNVPA